MKTSIFILSAFLVITFSSCCPGKHGTGSVVSNDTLVNVQTVIDSIQSQYNLAKLYLPSTNLIQLKEVDVVFDVSNTSIINGSLEIVVVKAGYTRTVSKGSTITFTLENKKVEKADLAPGAIPPPTKELAALICNTAIQFAKLKAIDNTTPSQFEVDVEFSIENDGSINLTSPIGIFTPGIGYERSRKTTNTIKLTFEPKK